MVNLFILKLFYNSGTEVDFSNLHKIGDHTARLAEAQDASVSGVTISDGESGDVDFPHGNLKVLAVSFPFLT